MKAKIKHTGETVEVEPAGTCHSVVQMYQTKDGRKFPVHGLEFEKDIDWEQRRYETAKSAMQGILFGFTMTEEDIERNCHHVASSAIMLADALIGELRKGGAPC